MKYTKCCIVLVAGLLALGPFLSAKNPSEAKTEQDRLQNAGTVMQEILKVPDDIPQDLLDKARCVVVMPSVLKAAFVVGGSYGRGTMICRTGKDFTGPWGAPAMYYRLRLSCHERPRRRQPAAHQGETGSGCIYRRWTEGTFGGSRYRRLYACGDSELLSRKRCVCRYLPGRLDASSR